jgi:hypothetical protein
MASVCGQHYDIDSNIERVEITLKVLITTNIDKSSFIVFMLFMIVPINSDRMKAVLRIWRIIANTCIYGAYTKEWCGE